MNRTHRAVLMCHLVFVSYKVDNAAYLALPEKWRSYVEQHARLGERIRLTHAEMTVVTQTKSIHMLAMLMAIPSIVLVYGNSSTKMEWSQMVIVETEAFILLLFCIAGLIEVALAPRLNPKQRLKLVAQTLLSAICGLIAFFYLRDATG